jgi:hypothetical protein
MRFAMGRKNEEEKDLFARFDARLERLGSSEISIELVEIEGYELVVCR